MDKNLAYLKEKLLTILPKTNQFTIELKLQVIMKLHKALNYTMTEDDFKDICEYCYEILDVLEKLSVGDCFIKGLLCYEIAKHKVQLAKLSPSINVSKNSL